MKKIVSLVLAISMVLSMFVSVFATTSTFEDVAGTRYAGSVEALVELGVINGMPDGTYAPEKTVTRAELAKMLVICLGLGDSASALAGKTVFTDVADSHWASGYINAAVQTKVIAGYPDGTFKPEKEVSYQEAVTMVIRALGYGNVVDTEGTWPTAYILKAVELELYDGMEDPTATAAALRGNVAVLLWNMLRTPMWKITEESEGMGMTSKADSLMLNVKFPKYRYAEEAYVNDVQVDEGKVNVTLDLDYLTGEGLTATVTAKVEDIDLPRVVEGMKVSALIKNFKDEEKATFVTLTPANTMVEGLVTKVEVEDNAIVSLEIDDVKYKIDDKATLTNEDIQKNDYVVAEVNGKKVNAHGNKAVIKYLPVENTTEVEKLKVMEGKVDEDALVIIDGVWSTRDDIEVGDVYTPITGDGDTYYMVTRERVEGAFESLTREKDDKEVAYFEVDSEKYTAFSSVKVFEGEENDEKVELAKLEVKEKDNKYLDQDVELVLNYLGQVVTVYFGEVSNLDANGDFYVVMSNGLWFSSTSAGKQAHIVLTGVDGVEETYDFAKAYEYAAEVGEDLVYASGDPRFVWAKFDDNGLVKNVVLLENGLTSGDESGYKGEYSFASFSGEINDDNYVGEYKVSSSTVVVTATPVKDEDDLVIGFEVEVTEGKDALEGVTAGLVAYENETPNRARFIFVAEEAKSQDLNFGKVEAVRQSRGQNVYATISGVEYPVETEDVEVYNSYEVIKALDNCLVAFVENNGKIEIKRHVANTDLDGMAWVEEVEGEFVTISGDDTYSGDYDVETEAVIDQFKKFTFVAVDAYENEDKVVEFEADVENLGKGIATAKFAKGDRVTIDEGLKVVVIVKGFDVEDTFTAEGGVIYGE